MVYNYTKPRRPVAASETGPGPCYALPPLVGHDQHDPRSSYGKGPAYQFGIVHRHPTGPFSPGPCYLPKPTVSRVGKDGTPSYSIYSRPKELEMFNYPGPGSYSHQWMRSLTRPRAPAYTFGSNALYRSADANPGPNVYTIPPSLGKTIESRLRQAPSHSIFGRSKVGNFYDDIKKTPGPGAYTVSNTNQYKTKSAEYSIIGRNVMPGDGTIKPGPGAHSPERVTIHQRHEPRYSFGIRHSDYVAPILLDVLE